MTIEEFIQIWQNTTLTERSASQQHFIQLCQLLGEKTPAELDPDGTFFTFEKGANKTTGTRGWADVWLKGCFAWEYKGKGKDLKKAFVQLQQYAIALENPPLLIVSDTQTIEIHTNFTNTVAEVHSLKLEDLRDSSKLMLLKTLFNKDKIEQVFKPKQTRDNVTLQMAEQFTELAQRLRNRGHAPQQVAHFINRLVFCMFAEDIGILPKKLLTNLLESVIKKLQLGKNHFEQRIGQLFAAMNKGGDFGVDEIDWFNGGLFDDNSALPLENQDIQDLLKAAQQDWKDIEPSIFGTLFERGLDPDKRSQLGAHYTDRNSILRILEPVIFAPLQAEWAEIRDKIQALLIESDLKYKNKKNKQETEANALYHGFLERLENIQVLDPACGSGNFLYLALLGLKDLEHKVLIEAEQLGLQRQFPRISPKSLNGIEINQYASELARVTVWIGQIQWMLGHGYNLKKDPILEKLDNIECCDALLNADGTEKQWKAVDFIVSNPPFLGDKRMISILGEDYVSQLRSLFQGRVAGGADLVCYWFEKTRAQLEQNKAKIAGLVATNSIRGGSNRKVLENIRETGKIFHAWSDEEWVNEGAAVRVSLVCFARAELNLPHLLNNQPISEIYSDLTAPNAGQALDLTKAKQLAENSGVSFIGTQKNGAFDITGDLAREWLKSSFNPHGKPNSDVLRPWANGIDITRRYSDTWIIDFGVNMSEDEASLYEKPFEYILKNVKPERLKNREERIRVYWWLHKRMVPAIREAIKPLSRFIATSMVAKYRLFVWLPKIQIPENLVVVIARDDDTTFGILHSRFHELWSLRLCTWLGKGNDPRYTPTTTFETFPFPEGLSPNIPAADYAENPHAQAIANAAKRLNELRENWLNPPDLVQRVPEIVAGYPERILPINEDAAKELKKRTLTNLYNQQPQWLKKAHETLDNTVASAYGCENNLSDEEILGKLLALNLERSTRLGVIANT